MTNRAFYGALSLLAGLFLTAILPACNSSDNSSYYAYESYGSTAITAFSLNSNPKVLYHLDSVYFSIDLDNARIFNAQPLPYGTRIDALTVNISTDNCSEVELNFKTRWGNDTTINYLTSEVDSINFADGPVGVRAVSYDGLSVRNYRIYVNVYDSNPDSMLWDMQMADVPVVQGSLQDMKTVECAGTYFMLGFDGSNYTVSSTTDLYSPYAWTDARRVDFGTGVKVESFSADNYGTLYILGNDGHLMSSTDGGLSWTGTGQTMSAIIGGYQDYIVGLVVDGDNVYTKNYPGDGSAVAQPSDFPVAGLSGLIISNSAWEVTPLAVMTGGVKLDGTLSGDTWGYDGSSWVKLSGATLQPAQGRGVFKYQLAETDSTNWRVTYRDILVSVGGRLADNAIDSVYISNDLGLHWKKAPEEMQIPAGVPAVYGQQMLMQYHVIGSMGRAVAPITEWPCPYVYLSGGRKLNGTLNRQIWQGVVRRYTFVPLQ